ncbi:MAG TPA: trigger factor [Candidatus Babeliales bacterium]|nr:trigger factor [Candidatus Babeliales bacterium]
MKQKISSDNSTIFSIEHNYEQPTLCRVTIVVSKSLINTFFSETAFALKDNIQAHGFQQGEVPVEYITKQYKTNITEHLKEFFFKFGIVNFLFQELRAQKFLVAGDPRLVDIALEHDQDARFIFELSVFPSIALNEWKYFPFKAPNRKNYKDLDRQVESFIQEEQKNLERYTGDHGVSIGDWVNFNISIVDKDHAFLDERFVQNFWIKLGNDEIDGHLQSLFLNKKKGDDFVTNNKGLQDYFSDQLRASYNFRVHVAEVVPHTYFCFDQFKDHFRIKTNKDMHKKLIEVFSYRNDVSQRLAMVEEAFKLLLSRHRFFAPQHLVLRQQKIILGAIQSNPDYNVYRKQKDFNFWIQQLAEKQVKETLLIDQLIYRENITVSNEDMVNYLNLDKRPRMKEFVYFSLPDSKHYGQDTPLALHELSRVCAREKAINYVIHYLTKK